MLWPGGPAEEGDGLFWEHRRGISRGCPLSLLMGALFLHELDVLIEGSWLFYRRFQDDVIVLAPTRWKLRRAVRSATAHAVVAGGGAVVRQSV